MDQRSAVLRAAPVRALLAVAALLLGVLVPPASAFVPVPPVAPAAAAPQTPSGPCAAACHLTPLLPPSPPADRPP
ncbi:hypothetical protein ACLIYP_15470, partial [Streptomyces nanhaiensis]